MKKIKQNSSDWSITIYLFAWKNFHFPTCFMAERTLSIWENIILEKTFKCSLLDKSFDVPHVNRISYQVHIWCTVDSSIFLILITHWMDMNTENESVVNNKHDPMMFCFFIHFSIQIYTKITSIQSNATAFIFSVGLRFEKYEKCRPWSTAIWWSFFYMTKRTSGRLFT